MNAAVHVDFTVTSSTLSPISITFLAFINFARLAMNWDCSQATIIALEECSMVLWKQNNIRSDFFFLNQSKAVLQLWPGLLTSRRPLRAGCSLKEWLRTYCISGSFPQWLLVMLILENFFFPEGEEARYKYYSKEQKETVERPSH